MKAHIFAPLAALAAPLAFAQSLSELPACAQQAGLSGIEATGCSVADIRCICDSVPFISTLRSYIEAQCDASDQARALAFAQELCSTVSITISATVPGLPISPTSSIAASTPARIAVITTLSGIATSTISPNYIGAASKMSTSPVTGTISISVPQYTGGAGRLGQELVAAVVAVGAFVVAL